MAAARTNFSDRVWRMLDVKWQKDPYNSGSYLTGQRFNRVGQSALYMGIDHTTAIAEFHQTLIRPGTLAAYDVVCGDIVDLTQATICEALGVDRAMLGCDWRRIAMLDRREPPTWALADRLIADGAAGAVVPSFQIAGANLVLWRWHRAGTAGEGAAVSLVDPGGDLLPRRVLP